MLHPRTPDFAPPTVRWGFFDVSIWMAEARMVGRTLVTASLSRAAGQLLLAILLVASGVSLAGAQSSPPPGEAWSEPERWA